MNAPNVITISRFALIPLYIIVFANGYIGYAFWIVVLAGTTDVLDGYLARKNKQVTQLGVMLDPLADKMMMMTVFLSFLLIGMVPWIAAIAMFVRELGMIISSSIFYLRGKQTVPANLLGKLTTVLYFVVVLFFVLEAKNEGLNLYSEPFLWAVILLSYYTSIVYFSQFRVLNPKTRQE